MLCAAALTLVPALQLGPLVGGILSIQYRQVECQPPGGVRVVVTAFNGPGLYFRLTIQVPHSLPVRCSTQPCGHPLATSFVLWCRGYCREAQTLAPLRRRHVPRVLIPADPIAEVLDATRRLVSFTPAAVPARMGSCRHLSFTKPSINIANVNMLTLQSHVQLCAERGGLCGDHLGTLPQRMGGALSAQGPPPGGHDECQWCGCNLGRDRRLESIRRRMEREQRSGVPSGSAGTLEIHSTKTTFEAASARLVPHVTDGRPGAN